MAVGRAETQVRFDDAAGLLGDRLPRGGVYHLLAGEGQRLFPDDYFADLFMDSVKGRPTVPARVVATTMLLQAYEGLSDREAVEGNVERVGTYQEFCVTEVRETKL